MSHCVWVGNLPYASTEQDVRDLFSASGGLLSADLLASGGAASLRFSSAAESENAVRKFDGHVLNGRRLVVEAARPTIGASACLCGVACRYDARANTVADIEELWRAGRAVAVCPEVLGGLPTPRTPSEIRGGDGAAVWAGCARVVSKKGDDVTEQFKMGAIAALEQITAAKIGKVVLKERSPSCGSVAIYDGSFTGAKVPGRGVAAAYFIDHGIEVMSEENYKGKL
jgi:uncharacterized protein YbbK (DUF523 family)